MCVISECGLMGGWQQRYLGGVTKVILRILCILLMCDCGWMAVEIFGWCNEGYVVHTVYTAYV